MRFMERIALALWRDRDGYDPVTETVTQLHNISLLTRFRRCRSSFRASLSRDISWLGGALIGAAGTLLAAWIALPGNNDVTKPDQKVNQTAGELLLKCVQQSEGVLICRKVTNGSNDVVARPVVRDISASKTTAPLPRHKNCHSNDIIRTIIA